MRRLGRVEHEVERPDGIDHHGGPDPHPLREPRSERRRLDPKASSFALLGQVQLGGVDGRSTHRLLRVASLFQDCGLGVGIPADIGTWLWVLFAIRCGVIGSVVAVGTSRSS